MAAGAEQQSGPFPRDVLPPTCPKMTRAVRTRSPSPWIREQVGDLRAAGQGDGMQLHFIVL
jgi:hypothetical protein